eukprot:1655218-Amphidinium_carterae.1
MLAVMHFAISTNSFTGMLPKSGFGKVTGFHIANNLFAGALSDRGMRAMLAVIVFAINTNSLTGMLPE